MKRILNTSTFIIVLLTIGLTPSTFAQEGFTTESLVNETIALGNTSDSFKVTNDSSVTLEETTIPEQIVTNATLAYAQEGAITPEGMNNTMSTENATEWTANATLATPAFAQEGDNSVIIPQGAATPNNPPYYVPPEITVSSSTTVTWTNEDSIIHTVTEGSPQSTGSTPAFDFSIIAPNQTWDNTFDTAGEFDYYCTLHPFMTGKVIVT